MSLRSLGFSILTALPLASLVLACAWNGQVDTLNPNVLPSSRLQGRATVGVVGVTNEKFCSESGSLKDFCVDGAESALTNGLGTVLGRFGLASGGGGYTVELRIVDFSHSLESVSENAGSASMTISWQFSMQAADGTVVAQLAERTTGPQNVSGRRDVGPATSRLFEAILERVSATVDEALQS